MNTKLDVNKLNEVVSFLETVGEGIYVEVSTHNYNSYEEAKHNAEMLGDVLGLVITSEGTAEEINGGWIVLAESKYNSKLSVVLYFKGVRNYETI